MGTRTLKICRLCLKKQEDNFEIDDTIKEIMNVLRLDVNALITKNPLLCIGCFQGLKESFCFKSMCVDTEESIKNYILSRKIRKVNLKDVYWMLNENEVYPHRHQNVCRLCFSLCNTNTLKKIKKDEHLMDILNKHYPELDFKVTRNLLICGNCCNYLIQHYTFVTKCFATERKIITYQAATKTSKGELELQDVLEFMLHNPNIDTEAANIYCESNGTVEVENKIVVHDAEESLSQLGTNLVIKCEQIDIKTELDDSLWSEPCEITDIPTKAPEQLHCDKCSFTTTRNSCLERHHHSHKPQPKPRNARVGPNARKTPLPIRHNHGTKRDTAPSKLERIDVDECSFPVEHKPTLKLRSPPHQKEPIVVLHRCDERPSTPEINGTHVKPELCRPFKCTECKFTAKYRGNLKVHELIHKSGAEVTMHKCGECSFQTKHKESLKTHMLRHKAPSEIKWHKCRICGFKAKLKGNLKLHKVIHGEATFLCEMCPFTTKHRMSLNTHLKLHRKSSKLYKCDKCDFSSSHKGNLKMHCLTHKRPSETEMFGCKICGLETKYKQSLTRHMELHFGY